jgi:hypothetical protein
MCLAFLLILEKFKLSVILVFCHVFWLLKMDFSKVRNKLF